MRKRERAKGENGARRICKGMRAGIDWVREREREMTRRWIEEDVVFLRGRRGSVSAICAR